MAARQTYVQIVSRGGAAIAHLSVSRQCRMTTSPEQARRPKFLENSLLLMAGLLAQAPLWYQVPRWAQGLEPTFVHPRWMERSSFPLVLHMAAIHPLIWICLTILIFVRICWNYGWKLER